MTDKTPPCSGYEASDAAYMRDMGFASAQELPGLWDSSDFLGGVEEARGPDWTPDDDPRAGYAFPVRFITGIDPAGAEAYDWGDIARSQVMWQIPEPVTIERVKVSLEAIEIFTGLALIPLCDRRLPAEGQE